MKIERFDELITNWRDKSKDRAFYLPTAVPGPGGTIPVAGLNYGADNTVKTFKEFAGEYRKGSEKFGKILSRIMEFLRLPEFKNHIDENDGLKFKISDFETRSHINVNKIKDLLNSKNKLYSFDISIDDTHITFSNLKKTYKDRYVSGRKDGK